MAANMGRPCPADPIWYREDHRMTVKCACNHRATRTVGEWAALYNLSRDLTLWRVIKRMRCSKCGARDPAVEVV